MRNKLPTLILFLLASSVLTSFFLFHLEKYQYQQQASDLVITEYSPINNQRASSKDATPDYNKSAVLADTTTDPTSPTSCSQPSTCPSGTYWDTAACACVTSNTVSYCSPPSDGCQEYYQWNPDSCMCEPTTSTCYPPINGCPANYYWDQESCSCRISSTTCTEPAEGCAPNYYWDLSTCSCNTATTCQPPATGCQTGYFWDLASCSCKLYTTSTSTTSSGDGTYACQPPASGCGYDYYWDENLCICKPSTTLADCTPPSAGCSTNYFWDSASCSCKQYLQTYQQTYFDRLAYEPDTIKSCVKSKLTSYEYDRFRHLIPANNNEENELQVIQKKIESCWETAASQGESNENTSHVSSNPLKNEDCLKKALGDKAYKEIYFGIRKPTYEEHIKYDRCVGIKSVSTINYQLKGEDLTQETKSCLQKALTVDLYKKVVSGKSDVPYELRDAVDRCFGVNPQAFEEGRVYKVPDEIKTCFSSSIGEERFNAIISGQSSPTSEEEQKVKNCLSKLNNIQKIFLPPPPEEIPFLSEDTHVVDLNEISQETKTENKVRLGGKVVFKGKAPANSTVFIYIYSEPIVVTTKTDENGEWIYELEEPLSGEKHVAYASVKDERGNFVRSSVFNFTVFAQEQDVQNRYISESNLTSDNRRKLITTAFILMASLFVVSFSTYAYFFNKKLHKGKKSLAENEKIIQNKPKNNSMPQKPESSV